LGVTRDNEGEGRGRQVRYETEDGAIWS
jgi:hypothetical protein